MYVNYSYYKLSFPVINNKIINEILFQILCSSGKYKSIKIKIKERIFAGNPKAEIMNK